MEKNRPIIYRTWGDRIEKSPRPNLMNVFVGNQKSSYRGEHIIFIFLGTRHIADNLDLG